MRRACVAIIAVTLSSGCLRFGYDRYAEPAVREPDAGQRDASIDASAPLHDAGSSDAGMRDAGALVPQLDAATRPQDAGMDAAVGGGPPDAASADAAAIDAAVVDAAVVDAGAIDAGSIDAGPTDAATGDAAMEAGAADPCIDRTELTFCGGFEDSSGWNTSSTTNGTALITPERARSGGSSLHAATGAASSGSKMARRETTAFDHQTSGDIWARAFFYLPGSTVLDASSAIATLRLSENEAPRAGCAIVIRPNYVELGGIVSRYRALSPFPRDRWTCVELHIAIDNSTGVCEAYVDSMIATQSNVGIDTLPAMGYSALSVGLDYNNAAQGPVDLYIDDVATGYTRVGCD